MTARQPDKPKEPSPEAVMETFRVAAFSAAPEILDAERVLHAYQQAYKFEGQMRNVKPTTAEERQAAQRAEQDFRCEIFGLSGFAGLKAEAVFCHHPKIRSNSDGSTVNFLAEVRDRLGRSLIPCDDNTTLVPCERGLVSIHVVEPLGGHGSARYIPTYSPRAFQCDIDACADIPMDAPLNYLQREALRAASECLTNQTEELPFVRAAQTVTTETSANILLETNRGFCVILVKHDPKTLRVSFSAYQPESE